MRRRSGVVWCGVWRGGVIEEEASQTEKNRCGACRGGEETMLNRGEEDLIKRKRERE